MSAYKRKKRHMMVDTMPAVPLDEAEIFRWRDRLPPDDDEAAWAALAKLKKRDMNDIAAEGQAAFDDWWNDTSNMTRISLPRSEDPLQVSAEYQSPIINILSLIQHYPNLKQPIIHGLVRQGEVMNIVAPPKVGKTWLTLGIAFSIMGGLHLFDTFLCERGRVLIIDNELHCETIGSRITMLAPHYCTLIEKSGKNLDYIPLRGELVDLIALGSYLKSIPRGHYRAIILDAFYKFFPQDMRENDNAQITALYNQIDYYAELYDTTFILVHHSSKGNQSEKGVTDVGAGAGSQSRAADCHLVIREHENKDTYIIDAAVRSWEPVKSFAAKFIFPCWELAKGVDPTAYKGQKKPGGARVRKGSSGQPEAENAPTAQAKPVHEAIISKIDTPMDLKTISDTAQRAGLRGYGYESLRKHLIDEWLADDLIRVVRPRSGSIPATYLRTDFADTTTTEPAPEQGLLPEPENFDMGSSEDHTEESD